MKKIITLLLFSTIASFANYAQEGHKHTVITPDEIVWGMLNPARGNESPKAFDLFGDRTKDTATGMLVRFEKGFTSPPHIHNITYRGVVIEGLVHNASPGASKMWLPKGSFWVQPAGGDHVTAANDQNNLIYLEIDHGPYLVEDSSEAFESHDHAINIDSTNLVWVTSKDAKWLDIDGGKISFLWGKTDSDNGTFLKLPPYFKGFLKDDSQLRAVVVEGNFHYHYHIEGAERTHIMLTPSAYFSSNGKAKHYIETFDKEVLLYVRNIGGYQVLAE